MDYTQTQGESVISKDAYDSFPGFMREAIKEYYARGWRKPNFIALLLASGQTGGLAKAAVSSTQGLTTVAVGAAGLIAARMILTRLLTGPLSLILVGVSAFSIIALLVKNQKEIFGKLEKFRELIHKTENYFEEAQLGYRQNRIDVRERNLMVEGLLKRFLRECDEM